MDDLLGKRLHFAEYMLLEYRLRLEEDINLPAYALLRLRREFSQVLKNLSPRCADFPELKTLLLPPLPTDPDLLRRVQQPAPGFIVQVDLLQQQKLVCGDTIRLRVCFFGRGMLLVKRFSHIIEALGEIGICGRQGRFTLTEIRDCQGAEPGRLLWCSGPVRLTPQIHDLTSVLDSVPPTSARFALTSPARLLRNKRPLFRADFNEIFPFILRRVTGMLAVWANLDDIFIPHFLLEQARDLTVTENTLAWRDWRPLHKNEDAGGLLGSVLLGGPGLAELWPVLKIGELFGVGKGAAFGAGSYRLD